MMLLNMQSFISLREYISFLTTNIKITAPNICDLKPCWQYLIILKRNVNVFDVIIPEKNRNYDHYLSTKFC